MKNFIKVTNTFGVSFYINPSNLISIVPCTEDEYGKEFKDCSVVAASGNWYAYLDAESTGRLIERLEKQ